MKAITNPETKNTMMAAARRGKWRILGSFVISAPILPPIRASDNATAPLASGRDGARLDYVERAALVRPLDVLRAAEMLLEPEADRR